MATRLTSNGSQSVRVIIQSAILVAAFDAGIHAMADADVRRDARRKVGRNALSLRHRGQWACFGVS